MPAAEILNCHWLKAGHVTVVVCLLLLFPGNIDECYYVTLRYDTKEKLKMD